MELTFESGDLFGVTGRVHLHGAVIEVANPAIQSDGSGGMVDEGTEPHALNSSANDVVSRDLGAHVDSIGDQGAILSTEATTPSRNSMDAMFSVPIRNRHLSR